MENKLKYEYLQYKREYNLLKLAQHGGGVDFNNPVFIKELVSGIPKNEDAEKMLLEKYNVENTSENIVNIQTSILHNASVILQSIKLKIISQSLYIPFANPSDGLNFAEYVEGELISDLLWGPRGYHTCGLALDDSRMERVMYGCLFHSIIRSTTENINKNLSRDNQLKIDEQTMIKLWGDMKTKCPGIIKLGLFYLRVKLLLENINICGRSINDIASPVYYLVDFVRNEIVTDNKGILPSIICMWYAVNYHKYTRTGSKIPDKSIIEYAKTLAEQDIQLERLVDTLTDSFILYICEIQYHASILYKYNN